MSFLVEGPIGFRLAGTDGIGFDMCSYTEFLSGEIALVIGVICGVANELLCAHQAFEAANGGDFKAPA